MLKLVPFLHLFVRTANLTCLWDCVTVLFYLNSTIAIITFNFKLFTILLQNEPAAL